MAGLHLVVTDGEDVPELLREQLPEHGFDKRLSTEMLLPRLVLLLFRRSLVLLNAPPSFSLMHLPLLPHLPYSLPHLTGAMRCKQVSDKQVFQ